MKTPSSIVIPALLVAALLLPVAGVWAQEDIKPVPLPYAPENNRFEFDSVTEDQQRSGPCKLVINGDYSDVLNSNDNSKRLMVTNNPDDPCRNKGRTAANDGSKGAISKTDAFDFPLWPGFNNTTFRTDVDVTGQVHIWADAASFVRPRVQLDVGDGEFVAEWSATIEEARTHADGSTSWQVFTFNLGKLPETLTGKVVIRVFTATSTTQSDPGPRVAAATYGIGIEPEHQSYIDIPFAEQTVEDPEPTTFECEDPEGNNVTFEVNETQSSCDDIVFDTPDNDTTEDDATNETTDGNTSTDGNATADDNATGNNTDDLGGSERGIPGFETVAVASAVGLLAFAGHQRRRAPRNPGR